MGEPRGRKLCGPVNMKLWVADVKLGLGWRISNIGHKSIHYTLLMSS